MTDRNDILPSQQVSRRGWRRLSYTRRCGWVDWGHARPDGARGLIRQVEGERSANASLARLSMTLEHRRAYAFEYGQRMGAFGMEASSKHHYVLKRGLGGPAKASAAMGIFISASLSFERMQSSLFWSTLTDSGFSVEDLVSNLIGFYAALRGYDETMLRRVCGEVSVEESLRLWDEHLPNGLGGLKNHSWRPILFPTREERGLADTTWPAELAGVTASQPGRDWVRVRGGRIPSSLIARVAALDVTGAGELRGPAYDRYLRELARQGPVY